MASEAMHVRKEVSKQVDAVELGLIEEQALRGGSRTD
jgi:hypothetical protein